MTLRKLPDDPESQYADEEVSAFISWGCCEITQNRPQKSHSASLLLATGNKISMEKGTEGAEITEGFSEEVTFRMRPAGDESHSDRGQNESRGPEESMCVAVQKKGNCPSAAGAYA